MSWNRRQIILSGVAAIALAATAGSAHAWEPKKPIDFVIMAGTGGGADQMARFMQSVAEEMQITSKPLIPTNKGGGSGAEALVHLNTARDPDHTIMVTLNSFFTTPLMQPGLGIDVMTFTPVGRMAEDTFLLWVNKAEGITTFEQFLAVAAERGSDWVMGGTGKNSEDQIITEFLNSHYNLKIKYIPYKGGGEVAKELAGRQITSSVNNPSEAEGFYRAGDLIPLVAFTDERLPAYPDVPTLREKGVDFAYFMQRAVVGAPGMSDEAQAYYADLFGKIWASPKWQEYMAKYSLQGDMISGDELRGYWDVQLTRHREILKNMSN